MTDGKRWVFDGEHARQVNEARRRVLEDLLGKWIGRHGLRTALDAGCGIGWFSGVLADLGLRTVAFDGREENVAEARRRYPGVEFRCGDVESGEVRGLGTFDFVLCFGLLYHLENPFAAVRNLRALTGKAMLLESIVDPGTGPVASLVSECEGEDQGLRHLALIPSESCLVRMLLASGFGFVYKPEPLPDHGEFRASFRHPSRRTMLAASVLPLDLDGLRPMARPDA